MSAFPRPIDLTPEQRDRRTIEAHLRAAIKHPTLLADPACYRACCEAAWDLWPFVDLEYDLRLAHIAAAAVARKERAL